jgi:predicted nucleic acid-binding protein
MVVVADASPINFLVQIEAVFVLPKLFGWVVLPKQVQEELQHSAAPSEVRKWADAPPSWIEIREPHGVPDDKIILLDPGERAAILLAIEIPASLLLIDEKRGRSAARERGLMTLGTLGVLLEAERKSLLNGLEMFEQLITGTNFRATPGLRERFLQLRTGQGR